MRFLIYLIFITLFGFSSNFLSAKENTQSFYKGGPAISMARTALLKHDPKLWFDYSIQTSANKTQQTIDSEVINTIKEIQLYPNPSTGVFYLENMNQELKTITVYNLQGVKIDIFTCEETTFVSPKLPNGFYLIKIQSLHETHQFKLVIYE